MSSVTTALVAPTLCAYCKKSPVAKGQGQCCSASCRIRFGIRTHGRKNPKRIKLTGWDIARLQSEGRTLADLALENDVSISTLRSKLRRCGIKGREYLEQVRTIYVPRNKTSFVLTVDPERAADLELTMRTILSTERIFANRTNLAVYAPGINERGVSKFLREKDVHRRYLTGSPTIFGMLTPHPAPSLPSLPS